MKRLKCAVTDQFFVANGRNCCDGLPRVTAEPELIDQIDMLEHERQVSSLIQIVYTSSATVLFDRAELMELLKESVERNSRAGITGLLLYKDGSFMQVLEGEGQTVKEVFSKIQGDSRHRNVITLLQQPIAQREFHESAMAFCDLNTAKMPPGYSDFLITPLNGDAYAKDVSKAKKLLLAFKRNIR